MSSINPERLFAAFKKAQQIYASYGLTTIQDAYTKKDMYEALCYAAKQGLFELDVVSYVDEACLKNKWISTPSCLYGSLSDRCGAKFFLDGSPQAKTAWLSQPYAVVPEGKPQGLLWVSSCDRSGNLYLCLPMHHASLAFACSL